MTRNLVSGFVTVLFGLMLSCQTGSPVPGHSSLDAAGEPLRTDFNHDVGKVRAILIGSPT